MELSDESVIFFFFWAVSISTSTDTCVLQEPELKQNKRRTSSKKTKTIVESDYSSSDDSVAEESPTKKVCLQYFHSLMLHMFVLDYAWIYLGDNSFIYFSMHYII